MSAHGQLSNCAHVINPRRMCEGYSWCVYVCVCPDEITFPVYHNITVDPFKAESKNTIEVEELVKEQEETRGNVRPVNDSLPSSRGTTTPGLATQIEEEHSADSIQSQTSVTSLHHLDSSTSTQVASKQSTNPKENSDISEGGMISSQLYVSYTFLLEDNLFSYKYKMS